MPRRRYSSVCAKPGCADLTHQTYCPAHTPAPWATSTRRATLPKDWPRRRAKVLRRDGYRCTRCGAPATDVDHAGDRNDHRYESLRSLCGDCHTERTTEQRLDARWPGRQRGGG